MRILSQLRWLPIKYRIGFKILLMTDKAIHGMARPDYVCKQERMILLQIDQPEKINGIFL